MDLKEIERLAFLKYRLSGKKSMNTFLFTQAKANNLTDLQIETLINKLNERIQEEQKKQSDAVGFTCNI